MRKMAMCFIGDVALKLKDQSSQLLLQIPKTGFNRGGLGKDDQSAIDGSHVSTDDPQTPFKTVALNGVPQFAADGKNDAETLPSATNPQAFPFNPSHNSGEPVMGRSNGEPFATPATTPVEDSSSGWGAHALAKTVLVATLPVAGLKCPFHSLYPFSLSVACKEAILLGDAQNGGNRTI